jgi:hypothetical protein
MSFNETIDCYRQYADSCVEVAGSDPGRKFAFLVMARAWSDLANQVEKTVTNVIPLASSGSRKRVKLRAPALSFLVR